MEDINRGRLIDDLIIPRKKILTDLWREKWEKEFNVYGRGKTSKKFKLS